METSWVRKIFDWYLGAGAEETTKIWDEGLLTLDANVLLDLYRYNAKTRGDIQKAIGLFGDRVWLPGQAAREFIRNRTKVIASADKTFREANTVIADLRNSCIAARDKLRGHRLVPRDALDEMSSAIDGAINAASEKIKDAQEVHPDFLRDDPLLDWIMSTFDGRIGDEPSVEQWEEIRKIGEARRLARVPPGYKDDDKEGDRKYGDYLLWRQILDHARAVPTPVILVTSERKEDWWEEQGGKTIGPRAELREEAAAEAGQRILIYQTDRFLQYALARIGDEVDTSSVDDIREVDAERSRRHARHTAVQVTQNMTNDDGDPFDNAGTARIELLRPVSNFTATVRLDPDVDWTGAEVKAHLVAKPAAAPDAKVVARISSSGRLNLHGHPLERVQFPAGLYEIAFSASIWDAVLSSLDDFLPSELPERPE